MKHFGAGKTALLIVARVARLRRHIARPRILANPATNNRSRRWPRGRGAPAGHLFIELLAVMTIICILVSILLPAVQAAREAARRLNCHRHLSQMALAVHSYESALGVYPPGSIDRQRPIMSSPQGYHHNWISQLLPYLEQRAAYRHIDRSVGVYHLKNQSVRRHEIKILRCPSSRAIGPGYSDYAAVHNDVEAPIDVDNNGVFFLNSGVRYDEIVDGTSSTVFIGEKLTFPGDLGWLSGTRATLRNMGVPFKVTGGLGRLTRLPPAGTADSRARPDEEIFAELFGAAPSPAGNPDRWRSSQTAGGDEPPALVIPNDVRLAIGGFGSNHPGVALFAFGDGSVRPLTRGTDERITLAFAHRADRRLIMPAD